MIAFGKQFTPIPTWSSGSKSGAPLNVGTGALYGGGAKGDTLDDHALDEARAQGCGQ